MSCNCYFLLSKSNIFRALESYTKGQTGKEFDIWWKNLKHKFIENMISIEKKNQGNFILNNQAFKKQTWSWILKFYGYKKVKFHGFSRKVQNFAKSLKSLTLVITH